MTDTEKAELIGLVIERLKEIYPCAVCALEWGGANASPDERRADGWKLMVMGRLSAQCTDARVNIVCRELFLRYPTCESLANSSQEEVERIVRPCGLFRVKAENIRAACRMIVENGGLLPDNMDGLLELPGVGRKIANLLLGDVFGKPGVVTDTHFIRICGRIGMYPKELCDPYRVERIMTPLIKSEEQSDFCHRIVQFGRDTCTARSPKCGECPISDFCRHNLTGER